MATPTFDPIVQRALELQAQARQQQEAAALAAQQRQQAEQARLAAEAERTRSRTAGELAGDVGAGLLQTSMGLGGALYGAANLATLGGLDRLTGMSENFQQANQIVEGWKSAPLQARQQDVQSAFDRGVLEGAGELLTTPSVLADYAVQSLGYLLPGAAAARAGAAAGATRALAAGPAQPAAVATAAQQAATRAGLAAQSAQTAGYLNVDAINAARDAGLSEGEQQARGLVGGAVGAVVGPAISKLTGAAGLEARAAQLGMGTAPTAGRTLAGNAATLGAFTGVQAAEEGAQESYEQMVRNWAGNKALMADVPQAGATGAVLGGAFGATLGATQLRRPTPIREQLDQARAEQEQTVAAGGESPLQESFLQSLAQPAPAPRIDPFAIDRQLDTPPVLDTAALERSVVAPQQPGSLLTGMDLAGSPLSLRGATPAPLEVRQQMLAAQREAEALNVTPETSRRQIGLDLADAAPAIQTTATGQAVLPQVDLLGELTYPRAYEPPVVEQPAPVVSRRQMGLDLAPPTAPIRVDAQGVAVAPGAYVPPMLDTAAVERQVRSPDQTPVLDTARLDASLLQPQDLPTVEDVFARFGPQVAAREQVRRSTLAAEQATRARTILLADEKAHRAAVRTALEQVVGEPLTGQEMVKLATALRTAGVAPGDTDFAVRVGELVRARLAEIPDTTSKVLGKLDNSFRGDVEQAAVDRAFDAAPQTETTEEAIFGPEPSAPTVTVPAATVPAASLADLVARIDAAMNTAASDAELETSVRAAIDAVLADPAYDRLSEDDWLALNSHIATVSNDVFGARFELAGKRLLVKPISTQLFTKGVITAASNVGRVQGFDTTAELAAAVGFPIPANAKGMYHNGGIYMVRENTASAKDMAYTLAHEVGHGGLDQLLGDSLTAATNRLWANPALRQRIRAKQAEVGGNVTRAVAAEEVLADMLASGERLNKDIWAKLRAGVREFFARVFGLRGVTVTNAEVDALLGDVARVIRGAPAAQVRASMANPDLWISNPVLAAQQDPKFAKVKVDLDRALADAASEVEGKTVPFDRLTRAAAESGVDAVKALGTALKMGKVGELWTHYMMHLDHLVSFYDKDFNGRLGTIAKLKELQQALFNRTLAEDKARVFKPGKAEGRTLAKASINGTLENWERFRAANPARGALLDYVLTDGTFYKLYPTLPWEQQPEVDYGKEGYTEDARKAAYAAVTRAYQQMGDTARELFSQTQATYADLSSTRWNTYLDEVDRMGKLSEEVATDKAGHQRVILRVKDTIRQAMAVQRSGTYSPLQRYGQFFATVRNAAGEVVFFAGYETQAEADSAVDTVLDARKAAGETDLFGNVSIASKMDWSSVGVSAGTIEQLRRDAEDVIPASLDAQTRAVVLNTLTTGLVEAYLQALPVKSFMKHALGRKNVAGYDGDALRGFANYTIRAARNIASIKYDGQIDSALVQVDQYVKDVEAGKYRAPGQDKVDSTKLRAVAAAVRQQHLAAVNHQTSAFVSAATGASFTYMMTSPSQLFMNATQTALVTLPRMMAQYGRTRGGEVRVGREILRAAADYFKSRGDLLGPNSVLTAQGATAADRLAHAALTRIREDGPLDQSQAHDIAGIADGSADALSPYWGKVMKWLSYFMHKSEVFNRQVTALAAARLEQDGHTPPAEGSAEFTRRREALAESGKFWIRTTHFNYDKANKPVALNTQVGTLLGQFRQYQIHMLSTMARDIRDAELGRLAFFKAPLNKDEAALARRTLSYMLGAQLAFTGAAGTVLAPVAFAIADAFRALDDDEELVDSKTESQAMLPTWAMHGLFGMALDTGRISAATLLPVIGQRDYAPIGGKASDSFAYYVTQNLGPSYGLAKNLLDGLQAVVNGEFYHAGQKLLPKPAADAIKALYDGANGAQDMRGVVYGQPSLWSGVSQFVGLRSAERRDMDFPRNVSYQINQRAFQFKERMQTRMALAQALGDAELRDETLAEVMRFNAKYPDYAVNPTELVSAARARMRTEAVAGATGVVSSRLPGPTLDAYLGR